jgi:hypothetical protein
MGLSADSPIGLFPDLQDRQRPGFVRLASGAATRKRRPGSGPGLLAPRPQSGKITESITWITPLLASISAFTTLALSTITPELVSMVIDWPCTV